MAFLMKATRLHRVTSLLMVNGARVILKTEAAGWPLANMWVGMTLLGAFLVCILLVAPLNVRVPARVKQPFRNSLRMLRLLLPAGPGAPMNVTKLVGTSRAFRRTSRQKVRRLPALGLF